jgi:hypothetical protein
MPSTSAGVKPFWPPDAFALAASILKRSGAYTEVANRWPPQKYRDKKKTWHKAIERLSAEWRRQYARRPSWPRQVDRWWTVILANSGRPLQTVAASRRLVVALVGVVAAADHACFGLGFFLFGRGDKVDDRAVRNLSLNRTLCEAIHPSRATVLPKAHNPLTGITLRSLTHNLALWDRPEVSAIWETFPVQKATSALNVLLLPWPLKTSPKAFQPFTNRNALKLPRGVRLFAYNLAEAALDVDRAGRLIGAAEQLAGSVEAVIFPELCMTLKDFRNIVPFANQQLLIAGLAAPATATHLGSNDVAVLVDSATAVRPPFIQGKHHRWRLDLTQIDQYGIGHRLDGKDVWWEAIEVKARQCNFFANDWMTFCVLICEDLARQDPVAELVRSVGPTLVIALLLDGPQIPERWPARYATVLAEDPRSSVLTLTSAGLVDLARCQYGGGPRSIGLWKDAYSGARQIVLEPGAEGVLLRLTATNATEWTIDGRSDGGSTGYLRLTGIAQVGSPPETGKSFGGVVEVQ